MTESIASSPWKSVSIALIAAAPLWICTPAAAQTPGSSLAANYAANSDQPIDIEADALEVDDRKKIATFTGNVSATQGNFNLRAREIQVSYTSRDNTATQSADAGAAGPGANSQITRIDAKGKVLVTTNDNQTATSDWARFEVLTQLVTIGGNVVLSQGPNTIKGDRLVIDLKTGLSRFENDGQTAEGETPKQRLRAIFTPKSGATPDNPGAALGN